MQPSPEVITLVSASQPPAMVIFWGPAVVFIAAVPTIRPSPDSPSPLFFRNLWTMPPLPGGLTWPSPRSPAVPPGCYSDFSAWRLCATSLGYPRRSRLYDATLATQLRTLPTMPPCPRLSPPRRCRHPSSPPASLLPLWAAFFAAFYTFATAGCRCPGNLEPSLLLIPAATFWESC